MQGPRPIHYSLTLEPDLNRFLFTGKTVLRWQCDEPMDKLTLNAKELAVWSCNLASGEGKISCPFSMDGGKEELTIDLPDALAGENTVEIEYAGIINNTLAGFYRSRYTHDGEERYLASTQFEESDARRAFPCFDYPLAKATFDVDLIVDDKLTAISNNAVDQEKTLDDGRKLVRFKTTPKMSTYLLFFGVGEFDFIENPGKILVRLAAVAGKTRFGEYGLDFGRKSLAYCEEYFDVPYPFPKLDLIAIPDFAFGAMENWGAVTYRENLLLYYEGITSKAGELRICEVTAHEIVHMWFGNLVSPSAWKYIWLNESFATYFGFGVVANYHPEWDIWQQFIDGQTQRALARDSLTDTTAIELPGDEHVLINTSTAPIIYAKGGSVLRQIKGFLGEENYQKGLRHYLKEHAFDCAASVDLWRSYEIASDKPVTDIMKSWVEQPGHPLIAVKREGGGLSVSQKRFTYLPKEFDQTWIIPLTLRLFHSDGGEESMALVIDAETSKVQLPADVAAYKINDQHTGFYRVQYEDPENVMKLGKKIADKILSPEDRWGLQNDLYALVMRGEVDLENYLDFLSYYMSEDAFLPIVSIAENLSHAFLLTDGPIRAKIGDFGRGFLEAVLDKIGMEPDPGEKITISITRDRILLPAVHFGSEKCQAFGLQKFTDLQAGKEIHADLIKSVMQIGAFLGDNETFSFFKQSFRTCESEHESMNILAAMACFDNAELAEKAMDFSLQQVPSRNKFLLISASGTNRAAVPLLWHWYKSHLPDLENLHPFHYERVISGLIPTGGVGREEEVESFFKEYWDSGKVETNVIPMTLEKMAVASRMSKRYKV